MQLANVVYGILIDGFVTAKATCDDVISVCIFIMALCFFVPSKSYGL